MKKTIRIAVLLNLLVGLSWANGRPSSPGDSIGWTWYDLQQQSQTAQKIWFDGNGINADFMCSHEPDPNPDRNCCYNFKLGGSWYGDSMIASNRAGFVALAVKPSNKAAVCAYHMTKTPDIYRTWVAVDSSQGAYRFTEHPVLPQEQNEELLWPKLAIDPQGNFHVTNNVYTGDACYYTRSTDDGLTWSDKMLINSDADGNHLAHGVFACRYNSPGKIIVYWTKWTGEGSGGTAQHAQNICYMISTDYGETWGSKINITNYQPADTVRAFNMIKGIFDINGDPHFVWTVNKFVNNQAFWNSWIMHWSPATGFSFVTGPHSMINDPGAWRSPSDFMNIALDRDNDWLYLTYVLNRDIDMSQGGYPNGEIMAKYSTDNGSTWISNALGDTGVNLTRTPTPGADSGLCNDDDYLSMHPYVETINGTKSLLISYLEDKDAGDFMQAEGKQTQSPYRVYVVPCESIIKAEEEKPKAPLHIKLNIYPNPSFGTVNLDVTNDIREIKLFDIAGRQIKNLKPSTKLKFNLLPGIYFLQVKTQTQTKTEKLIILR